MRFALLFPAGGFGSWARLDDFLDLYGREVPTAGDDHVVEAADDPEIAVGVEATEIAGVVPAVPECLLVGVGAPPVATERLVAREVTDHLPVLARSDELVRAGPGIGLDQPQERVERRSAGAAGLGRL